MKPYFLALNAGSSSLKFAVFRGERKLARVLSGSVQRIGSSQARLVLIRPRVQRQTVPLEAKDHSRALRHVLRAIGSILPAGALSAVAHRVVHGGQHYTAPQIITAQVSKELKKLSPFDPEHLPAERRIIDAMKRRHPKIAQVACFDTAFHRDLPDEAQRLPIPRRYHEAGVRRYGFHGLSCTFLMDELVRLRDPAARKGRVVLAHLGNGASITAVQNGRSIDTSMAFTPVAGLVMGSRSGDLDPGIVAYLARTEKMSVPRFNRLINHESGLLGLSGISADMQELLALESTDERAAQAIAVFCHQARKWIGALVATLGGVDTLVFSGGIGENCPSIRARLCAGLGFMGIELDQARNAAGEPVISAKGSRVAVRVIRSDEEIVMARALLELHPRRPSHA